MTPDKEQVVERLSASDASYPCIRCGTSLWHCGAPADPCCGDSDHPFATVEETIRALNDDLQAEHQSIADAARTASVAGLDRGRLAAFFHDERDQRNERCTHYNQYKWNCRDDADRLIAALGPMAFSDVRDLGQRICQIENEAAALREQEPGETTACRRNGRGTPATTSRFPATASANSSRRAHSSPPPSTPSPPASTTPHRSPTDD